MYANYSAVEIDPDGDTLIFLPYHDPDPDAMAVSNCEDGTAASVVDQLSEIKFKVSMKHLTVASSRAKAMFSGNFIESRPHSDGFRHWKFEPIFDSYAFEIVLHAIHGNTQKLPQSVSLEQLANIAAIVDDLTCQRAMLFFAKAWIDRLGLKMSPPQAVCDDFYRLILVSFVFGEAATFESATRTAIQYATAPLSTSQFPVHPSIIGMAPEYASAFHSRVSPASNTAVN